MMNNPHPFATLARTVLLAGLRGAWGEQSADGEQREGDDEGEGVEGHAAAREVAR